MKLQNYKKGKLSDKEELLKRREAIKKIKYAAISAATLMVLMPSKAKADSSIGPQNPF